MEVIYSVKELPIDAAVYAFYGGRGAREYVAYVGIANNLRQRAEQHLIKHDSSVTTGPSAVKLETQYISKMEWWGDRVLEGIVKREAAELVFSDLLQPVLVSRGNPRKDSRELFGNKSFYESMRNLKEKPSGVLILLTAEERIQKLEDRIAYLEEQMNTKR